MQAITCRDRTVEAAPDESRCRSLQDVNCVARRRALLRYAIGFMLSTPRELLILLLAASCAGAQSMAEKAGILQRDLIEKHLVDGLYVSMIPAGPAVPHT